MIIAPIEVTTRYATTVESLSDAWAFVMDRVDSVGPDPKIEISPFWGFSASLTEPGAVEEHGRKFSVVVSGMVEEDQEETDE